MTLSTHEALVDLAWAVGGFAVPWTLYRGAVNLYRWRDRKEGQRVTAFPAPADDPRLDLLLAGMPGGACQGADFSRPLATLAQGVEDHIHRDALRGVAAAIFRDRGGHAPGEACPSASEARPIHSMSCQFLYNDDECVCGAEPS